MPELPEVQTIINGLQKLVGKTVDNLEVHEPKRFYFGDKKPSQAGSGLSSQKAGDLAVKIKDQKILDITRRGKIVIITLQNFVILIHLKLTGQLIFQSSSGARAGGGHPTSDFIKNLPSKATNFIFTFKDNSHLFFNDFRKFGYLHILPKTKIEDIPTIKNLGIDPLIDKFNANFLFSQTQKRPKITIKQLLMDQTIIAGVGNIYSDESLFWAGVMPDRKNFTIKDVEIKKIVLGVKKALRLGLKYQGASDNTYLKADGTPGNMQKHFQVYQQTGKPCRACKTKIKKIKISGRSSHYCPKCQK